MASNRDGLAVAWRQPITHWGSQLTPTIASVVLDGADSPTRLVYDGGIRGEFTAY
ncbi:hypothetical protein [Haloarchaeobius sp. TZWWS8]|uniref:hypothetical protein n=1 Tax=Haloarchaeobius sp. TZWWS8 TaxID=3446121 RepID=UPI003EBB4BC3